MGLQPNVSYRDYQCLLVSFHSTTNGHSLMTNIRRKKIYKLRYKLIRIAYYVTEFDRFNNISLRFESLIATFVILGVSFELKNSIHSTPKSGFVSMRNILNLFRTRRPQVFLDSNSSGYISSDCLKRKTQIGLGLIQIELQVGI